jgi:hypothetical protein
MPSLAPRSNPQVSRNRNTVHVVNPPSMDARNLETVALRTAARGLLVGVLVGCVGDVASHSEGSSGADGDHDALFIGNSFTAMSDVPRHYRTIVRGLLQPVRVEAVTPGGYRLAQHAKDARTAGTALARWLGAGTPEETAFDVVVLQEQSQTHGLPVNGSTRTESLKAAIELSAFAHARGAAVVLYMTWGYKHGDPTNEPLGYETFLGMQARLDAGAMSLAARIKEQDVDVRVAPVGGAFRTVYEDVLRAGVDPLAEGSDFDALYEDDGVHQSLQGAYLAACVIAGTVTRARARDFVGGPTLEADVSKRLRDVCARTLDGQAWSVPVVVRPDAQFPGDAGLGRLLGAAVALSGDGERLLLGTPSLHDVGRPRASIQILVRTESGWKQEAVFAGGRGFGSSVALNEDGSRALVNSWPPRVFHRNGTTWLEKAKLTRDPAATTGTTTLGLNASGNRAILSGPGPHPANVIARVFTEDRGVWKEEPLSVADASTDGFGTSVALDGDGTRAIVGANGSSIARVFVRKNDAWAEEARLSSEGVTGPGFRVALSADGRRALVLVAASDAMVVFLRSGSTWTLEARTRVHGLGGLNNAGAAALNADGTLALVGLPSDGPATPVLDAGNVRVFTLDTGILHERYRLVPAVGSKYAQFGAAAAISKNGARVVVGDPYFFTVPEEYLGRAYTFALH